MKKLILILLVSVSATMLVAQNSKWSQTEIMLQSRFLQQPNDFKMVYDVGIGTALNYHFTPRLSMRLGGIINYGQYSKGAVSENGTLYIDFFKRSEIHYFVIETVKQWSLETPLSVQFQVAELGKNQFSLLTGVTPQMALNSKFSGFRFDEATVLTSNFTDENHVFFNDLFFNAGFSMVRPIDESRNILLEFGYEYSMKGKTGGLFIRTGIDF
jgi:hypothetical protein